jgi:hypothetical protein
MAQRFDDPILSDHVELALRGPMMNNPNQEDTNDSPTVSRLLPRLEAGA